MRGRFENQQQRTTFRVELCSLFISMLSDVTSHASERGAYLGERVCFDNF